MFDPKGTTPGLAQSAPAPKVINMKCKGLNGNCDSLEAREIPVEQTQAGVAPTNRYYACVKCGHTTATTVGGPVNF
jgi:hypothetical protein